MLIAFLCKISEYSFNHLLSKTERDSCVFCKKIGLFCLAEAGLTGGVNYQYTKRRFYVPSSVPNPSIICKFCPKRVEFATFQARGGAAW